VVKKHPYKVKLNKSTRLGSEVGSSVCQREIWNSVGETSSRPVVVRNAINRQDWEKKVKFVKIRGSSLSYSADTAARCSQQDHTKKSLSHAEE
jgi:hypothetical protein